MQSFLDTGVLSINPLVTFSKRHLPTPLGLAGACPELFHGRRSLHLVSPSWALFPADISEIARECKRVSSLLPDAMVVFLSSTDHDAARLSTAGVPTIIGNSTIFVDERAFRPLPAFDFSDAAYDAIYNGRFEPFKRHDLARLVDSLALVYDAPFDGGILPHEASIRKTLPAARFLNHESGGGRYAKMDKDAIARAINAARCGLCLSGVEGVMRASMEYLLCGVPIVSTESVGGRDRYYQSSYAIVVPPEAEAVRDAIGELQKRKFNKLVVREHIGRIVEFERHNFLSALNALARAHFNIPRLFETLTPFVRAHPFTEPQAGWSWRRLEPVAAALGVTMPPIENRANASVG